MIALALMLVLPLAAAHCVTMAFAAAPAVAGMRADHAYCIAGVACGAHESLPTPVEGSDCACIGLPVAPPASAPDVLAPLMPAVPVPTAPALLALAACESERARATSAPPPLPSVGTCAGLRGPPAAA
jgi:hypothetical protein